MTVKELREKSVSELKELVQEKKTQAQALSIDVRVKQEKSLGDYRSARKLIAQIYTVMREKEQESQQ